MTESPREAIVKALKPTYGADNPILKAFIAIGERMNWCADLNCYACRTNIDTLLELSNLIGREG